MDLTDEDIAKLVLGYLKSEKCKGAMETFLQSSRHLRDIRSAIRRSKHFITRVHGYCLTEIIKDYARLYTIILGYMEETTYANDSTDRDMPSKLIYLLENAKRAQSSTPSMSPRSRSSTPVKQHSSVNKQKRRISHNLSTVAETSPTACDINTTPLHELPGHKSNDNMDGTKKNYADKEDESDVTDNVDGNDDNEGSIAKVLAETLLENRELQEKLAENINSVIQKPLDEHVGCSGPDTMVNNELNSAIKAIVDKTEHDPVFERLLSDLIGPNDHESDETETHVKNIEQPKTSSRETQHITSGRPITENPKSSPKQGIEDAAVTSVKKQIITIDGTKVDAVTRQNLTVNTNTGEVILYDGTLENYMKEPTNSVSDSTSVNSATSSNLVLNTGLLMVQPPVVQQPQSYYVWNGSQIMNVSVPQYKVNNLSEQDILTMPTVIVCDENQQATTAMMANPTEDTTVKLLKKIAPKETLPDSISPSLQMYSGPMPHTVPHMTKKKKASKKAKPRTSTLKKPQTIEIKILAPTAQQFVETKPEIISSDAAHLKMEKETNENVNIVNNKENNKEPESIKLELQTDDDENKVRINAGKETDKSEDKLGGIEDSKGKRTPKQITPKAKSVSISHKEGTSTPKSGSHVRALDFNFGSPKHSVVAKAQSVTSPKIKSPSSKGNQTKISKSLFGSPSKNQKKPTDVEKKAQNATKSWDTDLRALAAGNAGKPPSPKKKKPPKRKSKKKEVLNKTEQDAKSIEDNLRSTDESDQKVDAEKSMELDEKKSLDSVQIVVHNDAEEGNSNEEHDMSFTLVNCNRSPRIKRKCNIDGNLKKEVKVTKVKEIKNLEVCSNKMILSPSKLNANKRTLVENKNEDNKINENKTQVSSEDNNTRMLTENKNDDNTVNENKLQVSAEDNKAPQSHITNKVPLTPSVYGGNNFEENEVLTLNFEKNATPENTKVVNCEHPVLKATRNLTPLLETPIKSDFPPIPKTPNIASPMITDTSLMKIFKEQLEGVDLSSIETPKFPITPNLTITPINTARYENRPTDYSTSSSYYQPSDTEQNKSLEQLIEESKKENKEKATMNTKDMGNTKVMENIKSSEVTQKEEAKKTIQGIDSTKPAESSTITSIVSKLTNFNKNVIGRKNLSLVPIAATVSFGDTDSENDLLSEPENLNEAVNLNKTKDFDETSFDSTESEASVNLWDSKNSNSKNVTIIQNNSSEPAKSRYPLRSRNKQKKENEEASVSNEANNDTVTEKETKVIVSKETANELSIIKIGSSTSGIKEKENADNIKHRASQVEKKNEAMLLDLEQKRLHAIALMKQPMNAIKEKNLPKQSNVSKQQNIAQQRDISKAKQLPKKKASKSTTKKASAPNKKRTTVKKTESNFSTNLNNDNSNVISPINLVVAQLENSSSSNAKEPKLTESKQDCLIRDLKERGIYLVPNKKKVHLDPPDDNSSTELLNVKNNYNDNNNAESALSLRVLPLKKRDSKTVETETKIEKNDLTDLKIVDEKNEEHSITLQEDLNLTDSFTEEIPEFDLFIKTDSDFSFVYNLNETSSRTLENYDLNCLNKSYTANVFIEELNKDIVRTLRVSAMDFILDIDPILKDVESDKVKIINVVTLKKCKPLETFYNKIMKEDTNMKFGNDFQTRSPLENLYEDGPQKIEEKAKPAKRRRSVEGNKKPQMQTRKSSRSISIDEQKIRAKNSKTPNQLDLMDFAIVGDEPSCSKSVNTEQATKRKATEEIVAEKTKCPKLCENLLSGLNVDHFLAQIHKK